jgi:hypothetical protein
VARYQDGGISAERYLVVELRAGCSFDGIGCANPVAVDETRNIVVGDAVGLKDNGTASLPRFQSYSTIQTAGALSDRGCAAS